jgi:hypothetical protein
MINVRADLFGRHWSARYLVCSIAAFGLSHVRILQRNYLGGRTLRITRLRR